MFMQDKFWIQEHFQLVEVEVTLEDGTVARAAVPSGASTGIFEAVELKRWRQRCI